MLHRLDPEFTFAGFTFPRYIASLPPAALAIRLAEFKRRTPRVCGPYYHAPKPRNARTQSGIGCYAGGRMWGDAHRCGDGMPGRAWYWADEMESSIRHRGWFIDMDQSETLRGIVIGLSHGRFLAGWSMGADMASMVDDSTVYDNLRDAALAADEEARIGAEHEREYQSNQSYDEESEGCDA